MAKLCGMKEGGRLVVEELRYVVWFIMAVGAVYVVVRVGSFAFFRTRLEHFRRMVRDMKEED